MKIIPRIIMLACILPLTACSVFGTKPVSNQGHPNIVFILTDDMAYADLAYMPKTTELIGDQGAAFDNFLISMALCCPSRACILRGQYPHNTGILANRPPNGGFEKFHADGLEESTFAVWLQEAGYDTALIGKYMNGYPELPDVKYIPPGWTEWYSPAGGNPYDQYNYSLNENGKIVEYGSGPEDYGTDVYSKITLDFIQRSIAADHAFFALVTVYAPHEPSTPAPRHADLFPDLKLPRSPSFNEEDVSDKPLQYSGNPVLDDEYIAEMGSLYRKRIQSLQAVDEMIASIVETLKSSGQLDNTYIFFTSDNGYHMGEHRLPEGKDTAFEEDIRVPLLVYGPGIVPGGRIDALAGNIDLAPTFAELAGVTPPDFVDGRSLVPFLLGGNPSTWREAYFLQRGKFGKAPVSLTPPAFLPDNQNGLLEPEDSPRNRTPFLPFIGIRTADYTYLEYKYGEIELYDLRADPYQLQNIASTADPSLLAMLHAWLTGLKGCKADACRTAEMQP